MKKLAPVIAAISVLGSSAAEKPLVRAGLISDTHVTPNPRSVEKLRAALKLFKSKNVDVVINLGDVADKYHPEAYKHYRNTVKEVYPQGIREFTVYAGHDQNSGVKEIPSPISWDMVKKALEIQHEPLDLKVINGIPFVIFPERLNSLEIYEKHLAEAVRKFPDKPIFVLDHRPAYKTVFNSLVWAQPGKEKILEKFPQVILINGHVHNEIRNELCIWQGRFTNVDAGCISSWGGDLEGTIPFGKATAGVLIMEVYPDKVIFERMDCLTKEIVGEPWQFPLPHNPDNPPLAFEKRKKVSVAPEFPAGSKILIRRDSKAFNELRLYFTPALPQKNVFKYEIFILDKVSGKILNRQEIFGDFYHEKPVKSVKHYMSSGYFESGREYIIKIVPFNFFGKRGKPIQTGFKAADKAAWTTLFECKNPMEALKFREGLADGRELEIKDGFYDHNVEDARLIFPDHVWEGKAGSRFRFTIDMHTIQSGEEKWTLVLRNPSPVVNARARLYTQSGDLGVRRYVIDFVKKEEAYKYYLLIREGDPGKLRFDYVKIERLD